MSQKSCLKTAPSSQRIGFQTKQDSIRVPVFSQNHPIIPRLYVQPWTQDIVNRSIILHNARKGEVPTYEHDDNLYLNKREQLVYNVQSRPSVKARYQLPSRVDMMHPRCHDPTQKYNSTMLARFCQ